jgi:hypothetical protein
MTREQDIQDFFSAKVPGDWFTGVRIESDPDEVLVVGTLPDGRTPADFREATRAERVAIASEAEARFRRKVSWGVESGGETRLFTTASVPAMTRLRLPERKVLDTLVEAGVARSRSDALAWCVRLVSRHQAEWLADLREALGSVERVRADGPTLV